MPNIKYLLQEVRIVFYLWHCFRKCLKHYYEIEQTIYSKQGKFIMFLDGDMYNFI